MTARRSTKTATASKKSTATSPKKSAANAPRAATRTSEQRNDHRVPVQLMVDYKAQGTYMFDFCSDLGTGGVFIATEKPMSKGSSIELTFTLPDSKDTISANGIVIWTQNAVSDRSDVTVGMGIQFQSFDVQQRTKLAHFIERVQIANRDRAPLKRSA